MHRVGRCARAGRSGTAYSLVTPDEYAYLLDLHLFLGKPVSVITMENPNGDVGRMPQSLLEEQQGTLINLHENFVDLVSVKYNKLIKFKKNTFSLCLGKYAESN